MENSFTKAFPTFANNLRKQTLKYLVQRTIFCKYTGVILDMRTAIMMDIEDDKGKTLHAEVLAPSLEDKLEAVKNTVLAANMKAVVKFYSSNKKLTSELITKL